MFFLESKLSKYRDHNKKFSGGGHKIREKCMVKPCFVGIGYPVPGLGLGIETSANLSF